MKLFIFNVPCQMIWTVSVLANMEDEAWNKLRQRDYTKLNAVEGNTASGKTELASIMELPDNEGNNHG